jgi:threonine synthase
LGWQAPDWIVVPVGGGGLALGICRGFRELREAGIVLRVPRLVAVQAEQCAPVYRAWKAGLDDVPPIEKGETSAEGIALAHPVKGREILRAIRACGGLARTVSEESIWETLAVLGRQGIYIEPTSAAAPAALAGLLADSVLSPGQSVVIVLTGIGLKATDKILQHMTPVRTGQ